jgi:hypothetical protein
MSIRTGHKKRAAMATLLFESVLSMEQTRKLDLLLAVNAHDLD